MVETWRGPLVESHHMGDIGVVDADGNVLWSLGDVNRIMFARSSAKPFQALPLLESGAADFFEMTDEELALACASHSGEPAHEERIRAFLGRIDVDPSFLKCGVHAPYNAMAHTDLLKNGKEVTNLHNNCSGKHAGMLALAKYLNADLETYLDIDHPVQQLILKAVSAVCGVSSNEIVVGTDGCGVPVHGLPLKNFALAYAKLAGDRLSATFDANLVRLRDAMMQYPHLVAGTDRFCTTLMAAAQGELVGKAGAEGVYCTGVVGQGIGVCVKVDDGNIRAAHPALIESLIQANLISTDLQERLAGNHRPILKNHQGTIVGHLSANFRLLKHLCDERTRAMSVLGIY